MTKIETVYAAWQTLIQTVNQSNKYEPVPPILHNSLIESHHHPPVSWSPCLCQCTAGTINLVRSCVWSLSYVWCVSISCVSVWVSHQLPRSDENVVTLVFSLSTLSHGVIVMSPRNSPQVIIKYIPLLW